MTLRQKHVLPILFATLLLDMIGTGMVFPIIPIIFTDRFQGTSKMSGKIVREALWMVWSLWFQNGLRRSPRQRPAARTN